MTSVFEPGRQLSGVSIGKIAHGGHCVARVDGRVVFVRNALPGEVVDVRLTEVNRRLARGEVVTVVQASEHRRPAPCPIAATCGGCDFQHTTPEYSRELKRQVVAELLGHLAGYDFTGEVIALAPTPFGWRRRMRYHLDADGRPGLRRYRSSEVVALPPQGCRIAAPEIARPASASDTSFRSYTGIAELNARLPLQSDAWLTNRLRVDFRNINGTPSQRYRVRLGAEWEDSVFEHPIAPYASVEALYDTRYERWSRLTLKTGLETLAQAEADLLANQVGLGPA